MKKVIRNDTAKILKVIITVKYFFSTFDWFILIMERMAQGAIIFLLEQTHFTNGLVVHESEEEVTNIISF